MIRPAMMRAISVSAPASFRSPTMTFTRVRSDSLRYSASGILIVVANCDTSFPATRTLTRRKASAASGVRSWK
jgi:hypothetical protein